MFFHQGKLYTGCTEISSQGTTGVFYCVDCDNGSIVWTYSANAADFYYTGENANIIFSTGNSEEFGAMVQLSARRVA